jgi:arylsulfatase A-like enzyme
MLVKKEVIVNLVIYISIPVILLSIFALIGSGKNRPSNYEYGCPDCKFDYYGRSCPDCNLLLITIDTLRADHLSCYGYNRKTTPNIDRLAENSIVFTNFYAPIPTTNPSLATIFTSKPPYVHKLQSNGHKLSENETTLAEILRENGYFTGAITAAEHISNHSGLEQGFETFDSPIRNPKQKYSWIYIRTADSTTSLALKWLRNNSDKKFFLWVHYFDPHVPYTPPIKYNIFSNLLDRYMNALSLLNPKYGRNSNIADYDGEIFFVDSELSKIIKYLGGNNLLKRTVVVITADHGESLGEHNYYYNHGGLLYENQLKIPLIIYDRGVLSKSGKFSQNTQLMPTILDILGIDDRYSTSPPLFDEEELPVLIYESDRCSFPEISHSRCYPQDSILGKLIAARNGRYKYIYTPTEEGYTAELYDLNADPEELNNLIENPNFDSQRETIKKTVLEVKNLIHDPQNEEIQVNNETIEVLKSLGYLT